MRVDGAAWWTTWGRQVDHVRCPALPTMGPSGLGPIVLRSGVPRDAAGHPGVPPRYAAHQFDDTYYIDEARAAYAALLSGERVAGELCGVSSNLGKQEVFSEGADTDLSFVPSSMKGAPSAPPRPAKGYDGGRLPGFKMLGAYIGQAAWCSARLVERVEAALEDLPKVPLLVDSATEKTALQCQLIVGRFCSNTTLNYFLRTCPPDVTEAAARRHDELIGAALGQMLQAAEATEAERDLALQQARLPVRLGGLGYTSTFSIRSAAWVGTFALCWSAICRLHPPFAQIELVGPDGTDEGASDLPAIRALRAAHGSLLVGHADVTATYALWDKQRYDFDKWGGGERLRFHPDGMPPAATLLPLSEYANPSSKARLLLQNAQRRYSIIVHHLGWIRFVAAAARRGLREAVRATSVSQPYAGAFLNAIPMRKPFKMPTWAMRISIARRLGLPLQAGLRAGAEALLSRSNRQFDRYGDVAQNDGKAGHAQRHKAVNSKLGEVLRSIWGSRIQVEPESYVTVSDYRPDLLTYGVLSSPTDVWMGDVKLFDALAADPDNVGLAGSMVGFGNTLPPARKKMYGFAERGSPDDGPFDPRTGKGHVEYLKGDYTFARSRKHAVFILLFETAGGFGPDVVKLLRFAANQSQNKLNRQQWDLTTWGARSWMSFQTQQLSVALHKATAWEILNEMSGGNGAAATDGD